MKRTSDKSSSQFIRYLLVGGFNTAFGYGMFALLNWSFTGLGSFSYMYAAVLGSLISISVAFLGYKWFVFRTPGNYFIEWIRCFGVYGSSMLVNWAALPVFVTILRRFLERPQQAPYIAAGVMMVITAIFSFLGHKNISFRHKLMGPNENPSSCVPKDSL